MRPPAPGRFATMTCWPNRFDRLSANSRARMSMVVPAVKGTTTVTNREGYCSCAAALVPTAIAAASRTAANFTDFIALLPSIRATRPRAAVFLLTSMPFFASGQNDGAHGRRLRADDVQREADERDAVLGDAIQILQIRHGDDAVFAQRARIMEHTRRAGLPRELQVQRISRLVRKW